MERSVFRELRIVIFFLIISLSLSACLREQVRFVPVKSDEIGESIVYIYRPDNLSNIVISPDLLIDGKKEISIKNNSHVNFLLKSGEHNLRLELSDHYEGQKELDIQLKEGKVYFYKVITKMKFKMNQPYERRFDMTVPPKY